MIHPHTELRQISPIIGLGPVATRFIPKGTIVWVLDRFDIRMSTAQFDALPGPYAEIASRYSYQDPSGAWILCWDAARFMNHHCEPAVRGVVPEFQITLRDLQPGDELTCDYAECNITELECQCGSPKCRKTIRGSDLLQHAERWDAEVRAVLPMAQKVEQPLWKFVEEPERLGQVLSGKTPPYSMRDFYFRS